MIAALTPLDPRSLTAREREAIEMIHDHRLSPNAGGYYGRQPHRITRSTAAGLIGKGIVRHDNSGNVSQLMLTGHGLATYSVMIERRQRRQA